jgi:UDP-glucose 4-epimerase
VREKLGWQPRYDDLSTIVRDALNWERELIRRRSTAADKGRKAAV